MKCDRCGAETRVRHLLAIPRVESDPWDNLHTVPGSAHVLWVCSRCNGGSPAQKPQRTTDAWGACLICGWSDVRCHCDDI